MKDRLTGIAAGRFLQLIQAIQADYGAFDESGVSFTLFYTASSLDYPLTLRDCGL